MLYSTRGMVLEVSFRGTQLAKLCTDKGLRQRKLGPERAKKLLLRLNQMSAAEDLGELMTLPQARCHQLSVDRDEQFSLDLDGPYRLIIEVTDRPIPRNADGGISLAVVKRVMVIDLTDTH